MGVKNKIGEGWCDINPLNEFVLTFGGHYLCAKFGEIDQEMRLYKWSQTDRQIRTHTDAKWFYDLSQYIA